MRYMAVEWSSVVLIWLDSSAERDDMTIASMILYKVEEERWSTILACSHIQLYKENGGRACRPRTLKKKKFFHSCVSYPMTIDKDYDSLGLCVCRASGKLEIHFGHRLARQSPIIILLDNLVQIWPYNAVGGF